MKGEGNPVEEPRPQLRPQVQSELGRPRTMSVVHPRKAPREEQLDRNGIPRRAVPLGCMTHSLTHF
jgi:hypothetical protein